MQEVFRWDLNVMEDMCDKLDSGALRGVADRVRTTGSRLGSGWTPMLVEKGKRDELDRFKTMGAYEYVTWEEAHENVQGKIVEVTWVRINKGTEDQPEVRCRDVAQELGVESDSTNSPQASRA